MKLSLKETTAKFIQEYHHIRYCELIIRPNGEIIEARPSHTECLIKELKLPRETIQAMIPYADSPLSWLVRKTKCVGVWYDFQYLPFEEITEEQRYVLTELAKHNKIELNTRTTRLHEDVLKELELLK